MISGRTICTALACALVVAMLPAILSAQPARAAADDEPPLERVRALIASDREAALERLDELLDPDGDAALSDIERARGLGIRGALLRSARRYDDARADAQAMLDLAEELDDPRLASRALHLAGTIQAEQGLLAEALRTFQQADARLADTDAPSARARMQIALGNVHLFSDNAGRAIEYFERARDWARRAENTSLEISALANIGVALEQTAGPAASLEAHREALDLARSTGDATEQGLHNANICARLVALREYAEAESHCRRAIDQLEGAGADRHLAGALMTMGALLLETDAPRRALGYLQRSLDIAEGRIPSVERELLSHMAQARSALGDHAGAADWLRRLLSLREELDRRERQQFLEELEARYRVRQAEREVEMLELEGRLRQAQLKRRNLLLGIAVASLLFVSVAALLFWRGYRSQRKLKRKLAERNDELEFALRTISRMAREDALTGLLTRTVVMAAAEKELAESRRSGNPGTVVMADIDDFKRINDEYGHAVGDEVLVAVANRLRNGLRSMDYVSRWGGEEFVCLLPRTGVDEARRIMERLRSDLAGETLDTGAGPFRVTLTSGIAPLAEDVGRSIQRADEAMYRGKRAGRNRVVIAGS